MCDFDLSSHWLSCNYLLPSSFAPPTGDRKRDFCDVIIFLIDMFFKMCSTLDTLKPNM